MNLPISRNSTEVRTYYRNHNSIGRLPYDYQDKSYMRFGRYDHPYETDGTMGFNIGKIIKGVGKAIGKAAKSFVNGVGKAFETVVNLVQDTIAVAMKVVKVILPPAMHKYIDLVVNPLKLITHPASTIALLNPLNIAKDLVSPIPVVSDIVEKMAEVGNEVATNVWRESSRGATNIYREGSKATTNVYREGLRPTYRAVMNVAAEIASPVNVVLDNTIYKVLPSHLVEKLERITDAPVEAMRGKLTDKDVMAIAKASLQVALIPASLTAQFQNAVLETLKKDGIIGPFIKDLDKYSGGLISSVQNLSNTSTQIYNNENIDWKMKLLDGLKVYLATISVSALLQSMATQYVGEEVGLNDTPLGRDVLSMGVAYYNMGDFTADAFLDVAQDQVDASMRREIVQKAIKQGIIGDADLANFVYDASTGKIENGKLIEVLQERADKRFQVFVEKEIKERTGLPIKYKHLVEIYNADYPEIWENVKRESSTAVDNISKIGDNLADEIARTPENISTIVGNVGNEIVRTPDNISDFVTGAGSTAIEVVGNVGQEAASVAVKVGNEIVRTPDNVAHILNDVGQEIARVPSNTVNILDNIATESGKAWENVVAEVVRTPDNISNIMSNVADEAARTPENMMRFVGSFDPNIAWNDLLDKYGMTALEIIFANKGIKKPQDLNPQNYLEIIDLGRRTTAPKASKSNLASGLIAGSIGLAALFYMASED